jgi:hypothetical protein
MAQDAILEYFRTLAESFIVTHCNRTKQVVCGNIYLLALKLTAIFSLFCETLRTLRQWLMPLLYLCFSSNLLIFFYTKNVS